MSKSILLTCIAFVVVSQAWSHNAKPMAENNLANTLLRSSESIGNNPQRSLECFSIYMPLLNEATNQYEKQYAYCLQTAANARFYLEVEVAYDRENVTTEAQGICFLFSKCSKEESSYKLFECYNTASGSAITTSYEIQTLSKNRMQFIEAKTNIIAFDQTTCTDNCSDEYIQSSNQLYGQLEACLAGVVLEPETSTGPAAESTTTN